jgi:hypothetical protein
MEIAPPTFTTWRKHSEAAVSISGVWLTRARKTWPEVMKMEIL